MADHDRRLQETYAQSAPPADHPSDQDWERLALNELAPPERAALFDHVTRCAPCAALYRGLRELEAEARTFDPGVPKRADVVPMRRIAPAWYAGLAAAAVLLVALLLPFHSSGPPPNPEVVRGTAAPAPVPGQPIGEVVGRPEAFVWEGMPGADRYRVELHGGDGNFAWASDPVAGTRLAWPESLAPPPGVYYWRVTALAGGERRLPADVASRLVLFEIVAVPRASVPQPR